MPPRVIAHRDAVAVAREWFLAGRTVDMRRLAYELAVGRATLYRVVGSREQLLGDVLHALAAATLEYALATADREEHACGVDRLVAAARVMNRSIVEFGPLRTFINREPETAFRVLFMPTARVHGRAVRAWREVMVASVRRGDLPADLDVERVAYMFVRIGESMIHADLLADREPDLDLAAHLQRALLTTPVD